MTSTPKKLLAALDIRDGHYCAWHGATCGGEVLTPQHRINRQMGGSKERDCIENLVWLCSFINHQIEADAGMAEQAVKYGIKLRSWYDPAETPVLIGDDWFRLNKDGTRTRLREPEANELRALAGLISGDGYAY